MRSQGGFPYANVKSSESPLSKETKESLIWLRVPTKKTTAKIIFNIEILKALWQELWEVEFCQAELIHSLLVTKHFLSRRQVALHA